MNIILLQDVRGLGKKHDVKAVSDGYAKNFLLPRRLAEAATDTAKIRVSEIRQKQAEHTAQMAENRRVYKEQLKDLKLSFILKTDASGGAFGSVTAADIGRALAERGIHDVRAELAKPLKRVGTTDVPLALGAGESVSVKVEIVSQQK